MNSIPQCDKLADLPVAELEAAIMQFLKPVTQRLPDKWLGRVVRLAVQGISSSQSPLITQMARGLGRSSKTIWAMDTRSKPCVASLSSCCSPPYSSIRSLRAGPSLPFLGCAP